MSKRILSILLCLVLAITNFAVVAGAEEVVETPPETVVLENGVKLMLSTIYDETCYAVCNSSKPSGDVVIPESYAGLYVRRINKGAFKENDNVTSVTMPDTVWVIMNGAFNSCPNLKWINISKNVIDIDIEAFLAMDGLEELRIGGELNGEAREFSYNTNWPSGPQLGYMNYFVRDGILFANDSLYFVGSTHKYFDNVSLKYYPQGKKDEVYKIPNDVLTTGMYAFFSPVYLKTLVIPASVRNFVGRTVYYYDYSSDDLLGGPINVVFQHDEVPQNVKGWYYNDNGVKKSVTVPLYVSSTFIQDAWDGSKIVFKDETAKTAFETLQAEKTFAKDTVDGDGGVEIPTFVVAPKATTKLTLDTKVDRVKLGETVTVFATQEPLDTTDDLEFSTADETIASFDGFNRGYLTANAVGTTTYYVKSGDKVVEHQVEVYCEHTNDDGTSAYAYSSKVDATCTVDGYELDKCSICGTVKKGNVIPAYGHKESASWVIDVEALCEKDGLKHLECSVCNETIKSDVISALGHNYSSEWTVDKAEDCVNVGSKSHHCSRCDSKTDITEIPATGHNYVGRITTAPTCIRQGVRTYTCTNCNDSYTEVISPNGHSFNNWSEIFAPTCTEEGMESRMCLSCGASETREIPALGHDYSTEWTIDVEPTCTENGSKSHHCLRCDDTTDETVINKLGHEYSEWVVEKNPTCTEKGLKKKTCYRCDNVITEEIKALGHTVVIDEKVDSTCSSTGLTEGSHCSVCNKVLKPQEVIEKKPHTESEWIVDKKQTCIEVGSKYKKCTVCGEELEREAIAADGHKEETVVTKPTCTSDGFTTHTCTVCNESYKDTYVSALGHDYGAFTVVKEPTCTSSGKKVAYCSRCNKEISEEIPMLPHSFGEWKVDKNATCTTEGSKHRECNCGKIETVAIPVNGDNHTQIVTIPAIAPTCTNNGLSEGKYCSNCNKVVVEQETISMTGHTVVTDESVSPTCTKTGLTKGSHCSVCGEIFEKQKVVPATGHNYGNWVITKNPTCHSKGEGYKPCLNCDEKLLGSVPALEHVENKDCVVSPASCMLDGQKTFYCELCGDITRTEVIPATGHISSDWVTEKYPTCDEVGYKYKHCVHCGDVSEGSTIAPLGHETNNGWEKIIVEPTCVTVGRKLHYCGRCNGSFRTEIIPATGHTAGEWIVDKTATCTENGSKHKECVDCKEVLETETVDAVGHNLSSWILETAPTCTKTGSEYKKCNTCSLVVERRVLPAVEHSAGDWKTVSKATCTKTGIKRKYCESCSKVMAEEVLPKASHTSSSWIVDKAATTSASGSRHKECTVCKKVLATETVKQLVCSKPKLTKIENTSTGIKIYWDKKSGADSYRVYRKTKNSDWKYLDSTSKLYFTDKTAKSGTKYYYAVKARNESGNSDLSSSLSKYYLSDPSLKTPSSTRSGVSLSWSRVYGASGYVVYRKTSSGSYKKIATIKGGTKTTYTDKSAKKGKRYTYAVKAYYSNTYSAYSNSKTITDRY